MHSTNLKEIKRRWRNRAPWWGKCRRWEGCTAETSHWYLRWDLHCLFCWVGCWLLQVVALVCCIFQIWVLCVVVGRCFLTSSWRRTAKLWALFSSCICSWRKLDVRCYTSLSGCDVDTSLDTKYVVESSPQPQSIPNAQINHQPSPITKQAQSTCPHLLQ
jgi:hypothetical protein